jgi:hypothetical protein
MDKRIEEIINAAGKINKIDLPEGFTDKLILKISERNASHNYFTPLLKAAVVLLLVSFNIYTLNSIIKSQVAKTQLRIITISDLTSDYQINDQNEELVATNN